MRQGQQSGLSKTCGSFTCANIPGVYYSLTTKGQQFSAKYK